MFSQLKNLFFDQFWTRNGDYFRFRKFRFPLNKTVIVAKRVKLLWSLGQKNR